MKKKLETYTVYGHCNLTNEKWYVGMTSLEPKERWHNGWGYKKQPNMWSDIMESNWNTDWIHTVFDTFSNREDALDYESFLMGMFDSIENGYNKSSYGSFSCKHSEESKKKISDNHADFSGEKHPMFGKHFSEEHKRKIAESMGVNGVLQFSKDGEFIAEYPSIREASRQTGCDNSSIIKCCKGKLKSSGGFIWKYKEAI